VQNCAAVRGEENKCNLCLSTFEAQLKAAHCTAAEEASFCDTTCGAALKKECAAEVHKGKACETCIAAYLPKLAKSNCTHAQEEKYCAPAE
jgi:type IV secretory pathway VirJ component